MPNNEKLLIDSTRVAYLKCLEKGEKNLILDGKKGPFTVKDLIMSSINVRDIKELMEADGLDFDNATLQSMIQYSDLDDRDKELIAELSNETFKWKIVDIHNTNMQNGFYGCVIETSDDNAIVGIRGSEGFSTYDGAIYDWVDADLRLLNNETTNQMDETERYAKILAAEQLLDKYKTVDVCGHSLGGNLSSHFAIACASNEDTEQIYNKLNKVCNFDGPGVSDEYITRHQTAINKVSKEKKIEMIHYGWSPVGKLLNGFPGEKEVDLKTRKYYGNGGLIDKIFYYTFGKHNTKSLIFDEKGQAERGKEGVLAKGLHAISLAFEQIPTITHSAYSLAAATIGKSIYQKEDGKIGFKLPFAKMPSDAYIKEPTNQVNMAKRLVNSIVEHVGNYTMDICSRMPTIQTNNRLALEINDR